MKRPEISVVIPAFNPGDKLHEAIDSVMAQSLPPSEIVLVDDGSDNPIEVPAQSPSVTIRVLRQENKGYGGAVNSGIRAATHDVIAFLDHDDLWFPRKTECQIGMLGDGVSVVGGVTIISDERGTPRTPAETLVYQSRVFGACLFRRAVFDDLGGLAEDNKTGEPLEWWSRFDLSLHAVVFADIPVLRRRIHGENLGIVKREQTTKDLLQRVRTHHRNSR